MNKILEQFKKAINEAVAGGSILVMTKYYMAWFEERIKAGDKEAVKYLKYLQELKK